MTSRARSVVRILAWGLALAFAVLLAGWGWERAWLGTDAAATVAAVEREIRDITARTTSALQDVARSVARDPVPVVAARDDEQAIRALFDTVDRVVASRGDPAISVTVYSESGALLAWTGRPDDLPIERITGPRAVLVSPGPLGLRLVAVEPVVDAAGGSSRRVGTVVAERLLSSRAEVALPGVVEHTLETSRLDVLIRPSYDPGGPSPGARQFTVPGPDGAPLLRARVADSDVADVRAAVRRATGAALGAVGALILMALSMPLWEARRRAATARRFLGSVTALAVLLAGARGLLDPLAHLLSAPPAPRQVPAPGWRLAALVDTPVGFLLTAVAVLTLVAAAVEGSERWRVAARRGRRPLWPAGAHLAGFLLVQAALGATSLAVVVVFQRFLRTEATRPVFDILGFFVARWDPGRLLAASALLLLHGALFWGTVGLLRCGLVGWRVRRSGAGDLALVTAAWLTPLLAVATFGSRWWNAEPWAEIALVAVPAALAAAALGRVATRVRRASAGLRLLLVGSALVVPSILIYPSLVRVLEDHDRRLVESTFASQVRDQREQIQRHLRRTQEQIDRRPRLLEDVIEAASAPGAGRSRPSFDLAYSLWSRTDLATHRLASAVEVYGPDGLLFSRFALNLPEYTRDGQRWQEESCDWVPFAEVSPLGSEQRQLQHAGRNLCLPEGGGFRVVGTIVLHVMPDFNALPFITSQSPYFELFRGTGFTAPADAPSREVEFVVYGWSRMPIYSSSAGAWPLDQSLFSRIYASRTPFWTLVERGGHRYRVYFQNDRAGIYALGYPAIGLAGHLTGISELVGLAAAACIGLLVTASVGRRLLGGPSSARALMREVRSSFYRKLFIAFVLASVVPVLTLALVTRAYIASRLRSDVEMAAVRTTAIAQRVIDEMAASSLFGEGSPTPVASYDDDVLVWVSRVLDQDVNIFDGARLVATSRRDLFAPGILPMRTPADVYHAVVLERRASFIGLEQAGRFQYLLAAAPVGVGERRAVLTIPLTSRQREIEREIAELDRRIVVAALLFVLVGAAIGYAMAERIADPVSRLTRAAGRIARGDLDARTALTSADEFGRLVEAFNNMAADLQRQRVQLERTNRLEAWAEMARQVAHEIKNPLTPIQLSTEHLRRVHADRGRPLAPVLDDCTQSILTQVRLLRQIAGEFSSFASSPTPRPVPTAPADLVEEVVAPYRPGLPGRITLTLDVPPSLPKVAVDRTLIGRALTNLIDNALHAIPGVGQIEVRARQEEDLVRVTVADTGTGLDRDALGRVFQPYFSTKATGTGLGLAIARRNVELNGGTIELESQPGAGTTVTIRLPIATPEPPPSAVDEPGSQNPSLDRRP